MGFINYEIHIRGKKYLESASRKIVLNKSMNILENALPHELNNFRKPAQQIKEIKLLWKSKVQEYEQEAYSEKEKAILV